MDGRGPRLQRLLPRVGHFQRALGLPRADQAPHLPHEDLFVRDIEVELHQFVVHVLLLLLVLLVLLRDDVPFGIDSDTGDVHITSADLIHGQYRLHVIASDIGLHPTLQNQAEIVVTVGPANDQVLRFVNSSVVFSIKENPPQNMRLGKILAVSGNVGAVIKYQIKATSNPNSAFRIDATTGDL